MNKAAEKNYLRKQLRQQRAQLSIDFCQTASAQIAKHLCKLTAIQNAKHLAYYWPAQNECDPRPFILLTNKQTYLPAINQTNNLLEFYSYQSGEALVLNQFHIPEPITQNRNPFPLTELEVVLTPLLGFDLEGNRLGMGGGYYDRSFAFLNSPPAKPPLLVGLAYEAQRLELLPSESWDLRLNYVVTEDKIYQFKQEGRTPHQLAIF